MNNFSKVFSAALDGIDAKIIEIETDINVGLHSFTIVGLADKSVSEAKERVSSALKNSGVKPPNKENRKIIVNLAPADVKKIGSHFDLGIAVGYLLATKQIKTFDASKKLFVGECALDGAVRSVNGVLNMVKMAAHNGFTECVVPFNNRLEAAMVDGITITPTRDVRSLIDHLEERTVITPQEKTTMEYVASQSSRGIDISDIKGQEHAKRALMIVAAGGHNILMQGSPGSGKTMLAQALTSLLPNPTFNEIIEATQIYSAAGLLEQNAFVNWRPFRAPHQTASPVAVIGGGSHPRPGEISLAHRGVLFLDELPEFRRDLLESLRQPIESGEVVISRIKDNVTFPAKFILVAAMNPCPCGFYGDDEKECICSAFEVSRYQKKISGPLLDRIDLQITVPRVTIEHLQNKNRDTETADAMRTAIHRAVDAQKNRFEKNNLPVLRNAEMSSKMCDDIIQKSPDVEIFLKDIFNRSLISARGYYRILKTAQTIADLENAAYITKDHLAEAFQYRLREA